MLQVKRKKPETKSKAKPGDKRLKNQFWKIRSKHGKDRLFSTPEILWEAACEYFDWCDTHPLKEQKVFGTGYKTEVSRMRAMTIGQLCFYLHCNEAYFRQFKASLAEDEKDYSTVICDIEQVIYSHKFQGAAAGLLNANIIARELGLVDKQEVKNEVTIKPMTKAEAKRIVEELEKYVG